MNLQENQIVATLQTLDLAIDQLVSEMSKCGGLGGTGRIQSFAPILINLTKAEEIISKRYTIVPDPVPVEQSPAAKKTTKKEGSE